MLRKIIYYFLMTFKVVTTLWISFILISNGLIDLLMDDVNDLQDKISTAYYIFYVLSLFFIWYRPRKQLNNTNENR